MHGQVTLLGRSSDPTNRTVEVWVTLGNDGGKLRANGAAQVTVFANSKNDAIVVPASAVTLEASNANEGTVMVVDAQNVAHETKVTIGIRTTDKIEIVEGLQGGETIVVEGNYALPDGTKVEIAADEEKKEEATRRKPTVRIRKIQRNERAFRSASPHIGRQSLNREGNDRNRIQMSNRFSFSANQR